MQHLTMTELFAGLDHIREAPRDTGTVDLIVRRPAVGEREIVGEGQLATEEGLVGDNWRARGNRRTPDGSANPGMQLNLMSSRVSSLIASDREHQAQAGDQFHVDFDLSEANVPPGTRLAIGDAVIEVTAEPHLGCSKFKDRFGADALRFVNDKQTRDLHLRGICAKVVTPGTVREGDAIRKF